LAVAQTQYLSLIRARILAHRQYPPLARARHMEGEVRLRFILTHSGALSRGVQIVKPSGFSVLDEQASQCVLAAAPFPPFPPDLRRDSLTVEVPIIYCLKDFSG
jgi:protein TonB